MTPEHLLPQFPHCDMRVLHAPGECEFCDMRPEWQALRKAWHMAFTGHAPETHAHLPCPADHAVHVGERGDYNQWPGNRPEGYGGSGSAQGLAQWFPPEALPETPDPETREHP